MPLLYKDKPNRKYLKVIKNNYVTEHFYTKTGTHPSRINKDKLIEEMSFCSQILFRQENVKRRFNKNVKKIDSFKNPFWERGYKSLDDIIQEKIFGKSLSEEGQNLKKMAPAEAHPYFKNKLYMSRSFTKLREKFIRYPYTNITKDIINDYSELHRGLEVFQKHDNIKYYLPFEEDVLLHAYRKTNIFNELHEMVITKQREYKIEEKKHDLIDPSNNKFYKGYQEDHDAYDTKYTVNSYTDLVNAVGLKDARKLVKKCINTYNRFLLEVDQKKKDFYKVIIKNTDNPILKRKTQTINQFNISKHKDKYKINDVIVTKKQLPLFNALCENYIETGLGIIIQSDLEFILKKREIIPKKLKRSFYDTYIKDSLVGRLEHRGLSKLIGYDVKTNTFSLKNNK